MAIVMIQDFEVEEDDLGTTNYDSVSERLGPRMTRPGPDRPHRGLHRQRPISHCRGLGVRGGLAALPRRAYGRGPEALMESGDGSPPSAEYTYALHDLIKP